MYILKQNIVHYSFPRTPGLVILSLNSVLFHHKLSVIQLYSLGIQFNFRLWVTTWLIISLFWATAKAIPNFNWNFFCLAEIWVSILEKMTCEVLLVVLIRFICLPGVNISHDLGKLFPDENVQKLLSLPYLLSKFYKSWSLFPDNYQRIL